MPKSLCVVVFLTYMVLVSKVDFEACFVKKAGFVEETASEELFCVPSTFKMLH